MTIDKKTKDMVATLTFNLSEPYDRHDFDIATNGLNMLVALSQTRDLFRLKLKYSDMTDEEYEIVSSMQKEFLDILENNKIRIDELFY